MKKSGMIAETLSVRTTDVTGAVETENQTCYYTPLKGKKLYPISHNLRHCTQPALRNSLNLPDASVLFSGGENSVFKPFLRLK